MSFSARVQCFSREVSSVGKSKVRMHWRSARMLRLGDLDVSLYCDVSDSRSFSGQLQAETPALRNEAGTCLNRMVR